MFAIGEHKEQPHRYANCFTYNGGIYSVDARKSDGVSYFEHVIYRNLPEGSRYVLRGFHLRELPEAVHQAVKLWYDNKLWESLPLWVFLSKSFNN